LNRSAGRQVASAIEVIEGKWTLKAEAASVGKNSAWIAGGNGMEWVAGGLVVYGDSRGTDGDPWLWRDLADGTTDARDAVDQAIRAVADYRAMLGATENRLGHAAGVLGVEAETKLASQSRIIDVDVAKEMGQMTRQQVLAQAGTSLLSQASTMPEMALHLLS
jgi:flagellin-like hook-associated protein FlgL